ncbi:MAG TPA: hypothetical protein PKE69_23855 [Pyrinomonadaceae bacterium]|nr:hypothetical protein [Pyrinomonadaceae bacterium]
MSNEVINIGGEQKLVREDTAKSYRGLIWALGSIAIFIIVTAIIFFAFFAKTATDGTSPTTPANIENRRQ